MNRRVVVTGMGAITPIGNDAETLWENAKNGVCGIAPITSFDTTERRVSLGGEVKGFDITTKIDKKEARKMCRFTQFALVAAKEAFLQSGISMVEEDSFRCGVLISTGIGGLDFIEAEHSKGLERGFDRVSPFFIPMAITNMAAGTVATHLGLKGMCSCVVTACAGGTNAIGDSFHRIRDGYADVMICGGTESSITTLGVGGFTAMRALSESDDVTRGSIPFDKERNGFVMGEGAGILVLEDYDHAKKRKAVIYGEVCGYGANCDAYHMTSPLPDGSGAARCMTDAMKDAKISSEMVDYINAHGTSTPMNDKCEVLAIKTALGACAKKVQISSTKSMTGHLLGAAGGVEAILTLYALKNGIIPPTIHYKVFDADCDLDIVPNEARKSRIDFALSNSFGFGGHNASLVFKRFEEDSHEI